MPSTEYGVSGGGRAHSSATAALRGHLRKAAGPFCFERRARKKRDSKRQVIGSACASGCNKQPTKKGEVMADIDDLRATFEQAVAAINRRDLNEYSALWHEQIVAFPPFSPFPVDGKAAVRQLAEANFANVESGSLMPINPQCRVIGTTGLGPCGAVTQAQGRTAAHGIYSLYLDLCQDRRAVARGGCARFTDSVGNL